MKIFNIQQTIWSVCIFVCRISKKLRSNSDDIFKVDSIWTRDTLFELLEDLAFFMDPGSFSTVVLGLAELSTAGLPGSRGRKTGPDLVYWSMN